MKIAIAGEATARELFVELINKKHDKINNFENNENPIKIRLNNLKKK